MEFLQHYWWILISLLGGLLVFLLFVQGGQTLLYTIAKTEDERNVLVNSLGRKWEFTFTTLVVFGGAFFASFPLFYSTSFGGAYLAWMVVLFCFVMQAVSYEYRRKAGNLLGERTYNVFLIINGVIGTICIGAVVSHAEQYRTALAVEEGAQCLHAALQLPGDQLVFCPSPFIAGGQFAYVVYIGYIHA